MEILETISRYYIDVALGFSVSAMALLYKKYKEQRRDSMAIKRGMQALLRNDIIKLYNIYMDRKYLPIHERDNLEGMYASYHELDGNGTVDHLYDEVVKLPVLPPK